MGVAPNMAAISNWRTKPVMREARVKTETKEADLKSDTTHSVAPVQARLGRAKIAGFAGIIYKHLRNIHHGNQAEEKEPPTGLRS
jgi:hypothetical protein